MATKKAPGLLTNNPVARLTGGALQRLMETGPGAALRDRARNAAGFAREVSRRAEGAIRFRVARVLNSLQIPTARDVQELNRRVADLQAAVDRLARERGAAPAPRRRQARRKAA